MTPTQMTSRRSPARPPGAQLHGTWFGDQLPAAARARLEQRARAATYAAGAEILREGDLTKDLAVIRRGRVALRLRVPERGPTTILTVEPGDVVGWSAVVPPHHATSTVIAVSETELILLDSEVLRAELGSDPELAAAVYAALLKALARRLTATRQQFLDLFMHPAYEPW